MTAILTEKNNKFYIVLSWKQDGCRQRKWIGTGLQVKGNKRRAEQMREELLHEWRGKLSDNPAEMLFTTYLRQWLAEIRHDIADTTYSSYKQLIENSICPYFDALGIRLAELTTQHLKRFYNKKLSAGLTVNTIRHYHANIHKALKDAHADNLIPTNPAAKVTLTKSKAFHGAHYTIAELRTLISHVINTKLETPVLFASWFGMRRGEIIGARWSAIDFDARVFYMSGTVTDKGEGSRTENLKYNDFAKTDSSIRAFPLEDEHITYLNGLRQRQLDNMALMGGCYNREWEDFLCVDALGNLLHPEYISRAFPKLLEKNDMRRIRFHDLRHTCATLLLNEGVSVVDVQSYLGHSNPQTTLNFYGHTMAHAKKKMASAMCSFVGAF